jgi:hypothetical protein
MIMYLIISKQDYPRYMDDRLVAKSIMEKHWQPLPEFTVPNSRVYPWMWLWDSCFHSIIWGHLGDQRCVSELRSVLDQQHQSGFIPHMGYQTEPEQSLDLWGVEGHSTITQPPMFGHALRQLKELGFEVMSLADKVRSGLTYFYQHRITKDGLIEILHPWESGADDSPRWTRWQPDPFDRAAWGEIKQTLVRALHVENGEATNSHAFRVVSAGFNALVAWNTLEAAAATGDDHLRSIGYDLSRAIDQHLWDDKVGTWIDRDSDGVVTSKILTVDSLLPILVTTNEDHQQRALAHLAHGLPFGPAGVDPNEPCYDPSGYWRGAAWPQLTYLLWRAAQRIGADAQAVSLSRMLRDGARQSGFSEYWNPATGEGLGARPQSWACLSIVASFDSTVSGPEDNPCSWPQISSAARYST